MNNITYREDIVNDVEMNKAWGYANFGTTPRRLVIQESLVKLTQGYHNGRTANAIVFELGLTELRAHGYVLTEKGVRYLLAPSKGHQEASAIPSDQKWVHAFSNEQEFLQFLKWRREASTGQAGEREISFADWVMKKGWHTGSGRELWYHDMEAECKTSAELFELYSGLPFQHTTEDVKTLRDAVKYVSDSVVLDTYESWCIHVKSICRKALREFSTPSHTVEPDKVEEEIKRHSDTWDAGQARYDDDLRHATYGVSGINPDKKTYLEQLKEKLKQL